MQLVVLYDAHCAICVRCRSFVERSETVVPVRFLDCRSREARTRYGEIPFLVHELVVVDGDGRWWAGPAAFVMTLWSLSSTRTLAEWLATPALSWLTRVVFGFISGNREIFGWILGMPACEGSACSVPHARPTTFYR
jgi:predicted DCC family thiol-disulfide oxidoreductase YuxK